MVIKYDNKIDNKDSIIQFQLKQIKIELKQIKRRSKKIKIDSNKLKGLK